MRIGSTGTGAMPAFKDTDAYGLLRAIVLFKVVGIMAAIGVVFCAIYMWKFGKNPQIFLGITFGPWTMLGITVGLTALGALCLDTGLDHLFKKIEDQCELGEGTKDPVRMKMKAQTLYWVFENAPCICRSLNVKGRMVEQAALFVLRVKAGKTIDDPSHMDSYQLLAHSAFECAGQLEVLRRNGANQTLIHNNEMRYDEALKAIKSKMPDFKHRCTWIEKAVMNVCLVYGCLLSVVLCLAAG